MVWGGGGGGQWTAYFKPMPVPLPQAKIGKAANT